MINVGLNVFSQNYQNGMSNTGTGIALLSRIASILIITLMLLSCSRNDTPKPRGFIRIDLPDKNYKLFDSVFPYRFEYPMYAEVVKDPNVTDEMMYKRFNIEFTVLKGTLHLSYEPLHNNLDTLIEDAVDYVYKHVSKATTITKNTIIRNEDAVFGTVFSIKGRNAASTCQFYITDSTSHFLRGALYLNTETDNDSLKTVIDFLVKDVDHMIHTFRWK